MSKIEMETGDVPTNDSKGLLPDDVNQLRLEILRLRDENIGLHAELAEERSRRTMSVGEDQDSNSYSVAGLVSGFEAQIVALSSEIGLIRSSWTWRVGRWVMLPVRVIKRIFGRPL